MNYIVMGVSGCGKSAVGRMLAERLNLPFEDADDFHPPANKAKMAAGQPLNDDDRAPWLNLIASHLRQWVFSGATSGGGVLACSALKRAYRDLLRAGGPCVFIHLVGSRDLLAHRLSSRKDHFFNPVLLSSQLATLEPPPAGPGDAALCVSIDQPIDAVVSEVLTMLNRSAS